MFYRSNFATRWAFADCIKQANLKEHNDFEAEGVAVLPLRWRVLLQD